MCFWCALICRYLKVQVMSSAWYLLFSRHCVHIRRMFWENRIPLQHILSNCFLYISLSECSYFCTTLIYVLILSRCKYDIIYFGGMSFFLSSSFLSSPTSSSDDIYSLARLCRGCGFFLTPSCHHCLVWLFWVWHHLVSTVTTTWYLVDGLLRIDAALRPLIATTPAAPCTELVTTTAPPRCIQQELSSPCNLYNKRSLLGRFLLQGAVELCVMVWELFLVRAFHK